MVDGGVLLGGFMVDAGMAGLLTRSMPRLRALLLCRCPDLTPELLADAVRRRLAPRIVVKRDCGLSEGDVLALARSTAAPRGVELVLEPVAPGEYDGRAFTYAIDE